MQEGGVSAPINFKLWVLFSHEKEGFWALQTPPWVSIGDLAKHLEFSFSPENLFPTQFA